MDFAVDFVVQKVEKIDTRWCQVTATKSNGGYMGEDEFSYFALTEDAPRVGVTLSVEVRSEQLA